LQRERMQVHEIVAEHEKAAEAALTAVWFVV
jgi:hypothetical protein